jgi:hypothetical protein
MSTTALPTANYVLVKIEDKRVSHSDELYVSMVSQTQAYEFTQYQSGANTVYVAATYTPSGGTVASVPLSQLVDSIDNTIGFYVEVFSSGVVPITGGRIYFADQANAVPYSGGAPGSIAPDAGFPFDFVEFTVAFDATTQMIEFNVDTTQVDQFGMPIFLQVTPIVPDFADGTGIVPTQTRAKVIGEFQAYTAAGSNFTAYQGVANATVTGGIARLLAPQHVIDNPAGPSTVALQESFDAALYNLFNYYYAGGGGHTLYLVGNGASGFEIFAGTVINNFPAQDHTGNAGTYTVFQFVGTGYHYNGADATLTSVGAWGGATYQIFYPYFSDSPVANSANTALSSGAKAPYWFGGFDAANQKYNLPITSAGRMVLGASGVFGDNVSQNQYYVENPPVPAHFDMKMLGNLENQLCTMLNRGVTPVAVGSPTTLDNLHLRTGSNTASDLIYVDLLKLQKGTVRRLISKSPEGATTSYTPAQLIAGAQAPSGDSVYWNTLRGEIYLKDALVQVFTLDPNDITKPFTLRSIGPRGANWVTRASFVFARGGRVSEIIFDWQSAVGLPRTSVSFNFSYGPTTKEAHYATLRLFTPYAQPTYSYRSGDLGPASAFSTNLVGADPASNPTSGMTVTGISFDNPTYVYQANPADAGAITIYSPQALPIGLNTNVIAFSRFYPVDSSNNPYGQWNAYAAFFHIGDPAHSVPPPTVDGKGYAFAFDDNGGYSSDITAQLPNSQQSAPVVMTLTLTLLPWG